jgi:FecR protein
VSAKWRRFSFMVLTFLALTGPAMAYAVPSFADDEPASSVTNAISAAMRFVQTQPLPSPAQTRPAAAPPAPSSAAPAQGASTAQAPADEPIGNVATLTGTATVTRNNESLPLKLKDDIYLNDVLQTSANSTLGVTFNDATTFNLTANAKITVDNYVYEDGGKNNSALFDVTKGTVAFVASAVAKTGDMKITTPSASLGIRGTSGLVEVQSGTAAGAHNIKLYPDPDGRVGHIDVNDRASGARLGSLTQGSSGFTVRPGPGGRVTATPLVISPQQAARDQGIVRQVHAAQTVGRRVVTEQRALRQANPNRTNPRGNQPGQGGPQRQNNLQQRPGTQQPRTQQPGAPNRAGQPGQPPQPGSPNRAGQQGQPPQPATANRPGQQGPRPDQPPATPGAPNAPGRQGQQQQQQPPDAQRQPNAPGLRQQGVPNKPAMLPKRPPAPRGKPPKEKKR